MQIELQNLSMTYPNGKQALQHLSLSLKAPSLVGLLGPNGAGKSTLMNVLSGTYPAGSYTCLLYTSPSPRDTR